MYRVHSNCCSQFCEFLKGPQGIAQQHLKQAFFVPDLPLSRRVSHFVWGTLESIPLANYGFAYADRYYSDYFAWKELIAHWENAPTLEVAIDPILSFNFSRLQSDMTEPFMQATDSQNRPVFLFKNSPLDPNNICLVLFSNRICLWHIERFQEKSHGFEKPYVEDLLNDLCPELKIYLASRAEAPLNHRTATHRRGYTLTS